MKKLFCCFLAMTVIVSLSACGNSDRRQADSLSPSANSASETEGEISDRGTEGIIASGAGAEMEETDVEREEQGMGSAEEAQGGILIAYFSWADNAILAEDVDAVASPSVIPPGNVQQLAGWVQEETGGDLFSIQVTDPYPSDWDECLARANRERGDDARPELMASVENLDRYDTVFLGYPNWWYGVPMALLSFLEQNDLSGKQVYLFCSHGTGGLANSVELITEAAPDAMISDDIFDCYEEDAASSQEEIQSWIDGLELNQPDNTPRQIYVQFGENMVVYELNDGAAATSLYEQLPLTVEVEDYSTNEKIFYPSQELETADSPLANGGAGTLAYYAPWGDVVMFYDDYSENPSLFELGQAVSGGELVGRMAGTVTISIVE